jgi:protein arginine phosphatase
MPAVLFVCTANICRSPMASALFKSEIEERRGKESWQVESAGTWAAEGLPMATGSQWALSNRGLDASIHRSRRITRDLLETFNLILTMEKNHKEALQFEFPDLAERVYLLSEMVAGNFDIVDPIGGSPSDFEKTAAQISQILHEGFEKIYLIATQ